MATISTVGYGDLVPPPDLRPFSAVYMLIGVLVVFAQAGPLVDVAVHRLERYVARAIRCVHSASSTLIGDDDDDDEEGSALKTPPAWRFYLRELGPFFFVGLGTTQFIAAGVYQRLLSCGYLTALWHCWVTTTTVGYGDIRVDSSAARTFGAVHILCSVSWLAALAMRLGEVRDKRKLQLACASVVRMQLDPRLIDKLDRTGKGSVDKLEFVIGLLIALGAQLCGEPLNFERDVLPLMARFDALDSDGSGDLSHDDLRWMIEESQRGQGLTGAVEAEASETSFKKPAREKSFKNSINSMKIARSACNVLPIPPAQVGAHGRVREPAALVESTPLEEYTPPAAQQCPTGPPAVSEKD